MPLRGAYAAAARVRCSSTPCRYLFLYGRCWPIISFLLPSSVSTALDALAAAAVVRVARTPSSVICSDR